MITLPSLNAMDRASEFRGMRVWLATQPADMRCGFDRLAILAQKVSGQDLLSGHLFVFRGRSGDRLKILYWDRDGYALWYKRLEEGLFKLPRVKEGTATLELRPTELAMLLEGIDLASVKRLKRYHRPPPPEASPPTAPR